MKKALLTLGLIAAALTGTVSFASPAHAINYVDTTGRAYYYNSWGQPVYYDTGYNASTVYSTPAYTTATPVYATAPAGNYYTQTTYAAAEPQLAAVPAAPAAATTETTYQYYYPNGVTQSTTYVNQREVTGPTYVSTSTMTANCRQTSRTEKQFGDIVTRYTTECQQADGSWIEQ